LRFIAPALAVLAPTIAHADPITATALLGTVIGGAASSAAVAAGTSALVAPAMGAAATLTAALAQRHAEPSAPLEMKFFGIGPHLAVEQQLETSSPFIATMV